MEPIEKLRTAARNMAKGRNLENHEECNLLLIIADEIEREIAEKYMLLPCDVNGEPIHVSDQVEVFGTGKWIGVYLIGNEWIADMNGIMHSVYSIRHTKPDPYKELLVEFAYKVCDMSVADGDLRRYADKFRELGKAGA